MIFIQYIVVVLGIYVTNKFTYDLINGTVYFFESLFMGGYVTTRSQIHSINFPDYSMLFASVQFLLFSTFTALILWLIVNRKFVLHKLLEVYHDAR